MKLKQMIIGRIAWEKYSISLAETSLLMK